MRIDINITTIKAKVSTMNQLTAFKGFFTQNLKAAVKELIEYRTLFSEDSDELFILNTRVVMY